MVLFHPPNEISWLVWKLQALLREKRIGFDCAYEQEPGEGNSTHSSTLAWKIPWTEEPGRLQPMGLLTVGYD